MTSNKPAPRLVAAGGVLLLEEDAPDTSGGPGLPLALPTREASARTRRRGRRHRSGPVATAPDPTPPAPSPERPGLERLERQMEEHMQAVHGRLDVLDRHGADLMFLTLSLPGLIHGNRLEFSPATRATLCRVVAAPPYLGRCPCCLDTTVLTDQGTPAPGAEFDHAFHARLNKAEMGWLICSPCHAALTRGGYLARFDRMAQFRLHQEAALRQREANRRDNRPRAD